MTQSEEVSFQQLTSLFYLAPAIVHVNDFYKEELKDGTLRDANVELWQILTQADILHKGKLTELGNTVFSCVDLVRYYIVTGVDIIW